MREMRVVLMVVGGFAAAGCASARPSAPRVAPTAPNECLRVRVASVSSDPQSGRLEWSPAELSMAGEEIERAWHADGGRRLTAPTTVEFRIDRRGSVLDTKIIRATGIADQDAWAQRAVLEAGPFEKPVSRWTICDKCSWTLRAIFDTGCGAEASVPGLPRPRAHEGC